MASLRTLAFAMGLAAASLPGCYRPAMVPAAERASAIVVQTSSGPPPRISAAVGSRPSALSVDQAVSLALQNDPAIAELRAEAAAESARIAEADDLEDPELRFTNFGSRDFDDNGEIALRAKPPQPGIVQARVAASRAHADQALAAVERGEQVVAGRVRDLFEQVLVLESEVALSRTDDDAAHQRLALAERERRVGLSTRSEIAEIAVVAADAHERALRVEQELTDARALLRERIGLQDGAPVELVGALPTCAAGSDVDVAADELLTEALRARPEVRAAGARIDEARANRWIEGAKRWPWLSFVQFGYALEGRTADSWRVGMAVDLPVFGANRDGVRRADADQAVAESKFARTVHDIARSVKSRQRSARAAAAELQRFRAGPLRAAEASRRAVADARKVGQASESDVLEAEQRWHAKQRDDLELLAACLRAASELRVEIGALDGDLSVATVSPR